MGPALPAPHAAFLAAAIPRLAADARLVGVAAGGSYLTDTADEYSDLDLVIEDRFWVWVHYLGVKIGRGEILEAADALASIRGLTFGPMALASRGARPMGVRKLEQVAPDLAVRLGRSVAAYDRAACLTALRQAVDCYRELRRDAAAPGLQRRVAAEEAAVAFVDALPASPRET